MFGWPGAPCRNELQRISDIITWRTGRGDSWT